MISFAGVKACKLIFLVQSWCIKIIPFGWKKLKPKINRVSFPLYRFYFKIMFLVGCLQENMFWGQIKEALVLSKLKIARNAYYSKENFNSSCINANYYVCQAKKIIGDSTDSFWKHVTIYFHASFIAFIVFCSCVTLCDGILYVHSNAWQSTSKS